MAAPDSTTSRSGLGAGFNPGAILAFVCMGQFMVFTDVMQIPVGAPHAFTAEKFMDFVYDPKIMAQITDWVQYVPPVKGVRAELEKIDPEIVNNELVYPDEAKTHDFKQFSPKDEAEIDAAFQRAIGA